MPVDYFSLVNLAFFFFLDAFGIWLGAHMILNRRRTEHVVEGLVLLAATLTGFYYLCNFARPYVALLLASNVLPALGLLLLIAGLYCACIIGGLGKTYRWYRVAILAACLGAAMILVAVFLC